MKTQQKSKPYHFFDNLFDKELLRKFANEPLSLYKSAKQHIVYNGEIAERGGVPSRKFRSVGGGQVQSAIYSSKKLVTHISDRTGMKIEQSGHKGTYTFYTEQDDYLDIHRDADYCDLTLITCLHSTIPENSPYGLLYLYIDRQEESLQSIYRDRLWGYNSIFLKPGQSILLQGGIVPHAVNPIKENYQRIISALCYKKIS